MTAAWLLCSLLAGLGFYLACGHQRLWSHAPASALRAMAWLCVALAMTAAILALGTWAGFFAVLTALMLALSVLPYIDAWWQVRRRDVG